LIFLLNSSEILKMRAFICVLATLVAASEARSAWKLTFGETREACPTVATKSSFDIESYLGDWYQVQGIPSFFQPADAHCVRATYSRRDDTSINVRNIGIFSNEDKEICGHADSKDPSNPAQLKLYFPGTPEGDYWVLDTDYENWSAVYSCGDIFGLIKFEYAFALTRTPDPSAEVVSLILSKKIFRKYSNYLLLL